MKIPLGKPVRRLLSPKRLAKSVNIPLELGEEVAMSVWDNGIRGNLMTGIGIGLGASILGPVVVPMLGAVVRPLAKAAIKGGIILYDKGREMAAEVGEVAEDLAAEAQAELGPQAPEAEAEAEAEAKPQPPPRRRRGSSEAR